MAGHAALDADFIPILDVLAQAPAVTDMPLDAVRSMWDASPFGDPEPIAEIRDLTIAAADRTLTARLYLPCQRPAGLVLYFHGGGWVAGSVRTHDLPLRTLANAAEAAILAVEYRLAPEHPFPAAFEDCRAALDWAATHGAVIVGEPLQTPLPLAVAGDSAGGNLAAALALSARDDGIALAGQLLIYPAIDGRCEGQSYTDRATGGLLTSDEMRWYWTQYAAAAETRRHPFASPCEAASHAGLAPAIVAVAEHDPLRDDGLAYANQLATAGNQVCLLHYETLPHGFINAINLAPAAALALRDIADHLRAALKPTGVL